MRRHYNLTIQTQDPDPYALIRMGDLLYEGHERRPKDVAAAAEMYKQAALRSDPQVFGDKKGGQPGQVLGPGWLRRASSTCSSTAQGQSCNECRGLGRIDTGPWRGVSSFWNC
ncbi:hypothetical protein J4Q44_G00326380 [Coregonus suidteri]|uniref:Uncharacterized protein n=1 Tax=Coregonus suidteri TaxID=861788 RepID=A0AAN8QEY3_9TELE